MGKAGVLVEAEHSELDKALAQTSGLVTDGKVPAVFEATFDHQNVLVRVDVLQRLAKGKKWRLIEVKSSTIGAARHGLEPLSNPRIVRSSWFRRPSMEVGS